MERMAIKEFHQYVEALALEEEEDDNRTTNSALRTRKKRFRKGEKEKHDFSEVPRAQLGLFCIKIRLEDYWLMDTLIQKGYLVSRSAFIRNVIEYGITQGLGNYCEHHMYSYKDTTKESLRPISAKLPVRLKEQLYGIIPKNKRGAFIRYAIFDYLDFMAENRMFPKIQEILNIV